MVVVNGRWWPNSPKGADGEFRKGLLVTNHLLAPALGERHVVNNDVEQRLQDRLNQAGKDHEARRTLRIAVPELLESGSGW